nr:podocan-like protein 1 isoform X4 [Chlorocebus sabaeus]
MLPSLTWGRARSPRPGPAPCAAPAPESTLWTVMAWTFGCSRTTSPEPLSTSPCRTTSSRNSPTMSCPASVACEPSTSTTTSSPQKNNLISKVPRGALSRQTQLRELYLQHNQLTDSGLDATTFSKLHSLEYLDLSHNQLTTVPAGLPRTLAILHLGRNRIRQVEAARLQGARGLRYLLLQHNQLGSSGLPAGALRPLRGLHTLHLYGNGLDRVPLALPRRLRALVLPHNHVATLGARDLAATPGLMELNLAYNRLTSARVHHRAFRRLRTLRSLDLAGNQLTRLPMGLPTGLHTLRLQRNQLRMLEPEPLTGLDQLQELSLAHNRLRVGDIGPGTWHELQALQMLDLSHNELSFVPPDLPEALEELHLEGNRIGHVGPEAFLSTPRLRALFLRCPEGGWRGGGGQGRAWEGHDRLSVQGQQASRDEHRGRGLPGAPKPARGGHSRESGAGPDPAASHHPTWATGRGSLILEKSSRAAQTPGAPLGRGLKRQHPPWALCLALLGLQGWACSAWHWPRH